MAHAGTFRGYATFSYLCVLTKQGYDGPGACENHHTC